MTPPVARRTCCCTMKLRTINSEVKAGQVTPHGVVYLDITYHLTPAYIKRRLPSMHNQFM